MHTAAEPLPDIIALHAEEACMLHDRRERVLRSPDVTLVALDRFDERIAAHLDGLAQGGEQGWIVCEAMLDPPSSGAVFVFTVRSLADQRGAKLERSMAAALEIPQLREGLLAAFGWVEPLSLRGTVAALLKSQDLLRRTIGVAACGRHRVDPGVATLIQDPEAAVRASALRTAGELGRAALVSTCASAITDTDPEVQFWGAWSAVLLGDREAALDWLSADVVQAREAIARELLLRAASVSSAHAMLQSWSSVGLRFLVRGAGQVGDPRYVSWLIAQMADDKIARLAGESLSMITGLDLWLPSFFRPQPEDFESGPTSSPDDENVELDEDDGLPWPDQAQIQAWWNEHGARFTTGVRHFMGAPPSRAHCIEVLKNGYQRQRIAAACHLCLLNPGTPLFEWRAPAWRQQRELAQMS